MADETVSQVDILLATKADVTGTQQTVAGLKNVEDQAAHALTATAALSREEATALASLNEQLAALQARRAAIASDKTPRIFDTTRGDITPDQQIAEVERQIAATETEILSTRNQILGVAGEEAVVMKESASSAAERMAKEEATLALKLRQQSIAGEQYSLDLARKELITASAAGDAERVELLRTEIAVRKMTLDEIDREIATSAELNEIEEGQAALLAESLDTISARVAARKLEIETMQAQEALNVQLIAQEEARLAFEKTIAEVSAQQAGGGLGGMNIARARNEATTLARELATGANTTRTFGALLGTLGPELGIAGLAAFLLYEQLKKMPEAAQAIADAIEGVNSAGLMRSIEITDRLNAAFRKTATEGVKELQSAVERNADEVTELQDKYRLAWEDQNAKEMASIGRELAFKQALLELEKSRLASAQVDEAVAKEKADDAKREADEVERGIRATREAGDLDKRIQENIERGKNLPGKIGDEQEKIDTAKFHIKGFGIDAATPEEAYNKSIGMPDAQANEVKKLVIQWQEAASKVKEYGDQLARAKTSFSDKQKKEYEDAARDNLHHAENDPARAGRDYALDTSRAYTPQGGLSGDSSGASALASVRAAEQHLKENVSAKSYEELAKAHEAFAQTAVAHIQGLTDSNMKLAAMYRDLELRLKNTTR